MSEQRAGMDDADGPLETSIILHELVKVQHQFINSLLHVHMSNVRPYCISIGQCCGFVFVCTNRGLEFVPNNLPQHDRRLREKKRQFYERVF